MSLKYTYSISNDFPNSKVDVSRLSSEITSSDITTAFDYINSYLDTCDIWFKSDLSVDGVTTLSGIVSTHSGHVMIDESMNVNLFGEYRDRSGKLRVHQTSRKLGLRIMWTGVGDDPTDITKVGGGTPLTIISASGTTSSTSYIDFNIVENETWLHEGYMTWDDAQIDTLTVEIVPRTASVGAGTDTNYNLYGGYMVIPAAGNGTISVNSDLTTHSGGLIYMPNNDLDEAPTAFWDAEWDSTTHEYKNITPAPYGNGRYNIFSYEITFARFLNKIPLLRRGFIALNSSDTDALGQGMRLRLSSNTNQNVEPHAWSVAFMMCLHREKSV